MNRNKIAVYIDYALRIPSFHDTFLALKKYLFEDLKEEVELEGELLIRNFWKEEMKNPEVETFYLKAVPPEEDIDNRDWSKYFYNNEHYLKFIEDYSFNLFVDASVPNKKDVEMLNIAQRYLFDVELIDEYLSTRKKTNTFFYLSKTRITPYSVIFLKEGEELDKKDYLGIWNPKKNKDHINKEGSGEFENWLKELELKIKNDASS